MCIRDSVVDADPQANASSGLGVDIKQSECTIYELSLIHISTQAVARQFPATTQVLQRTVTNGKQVDYIGRTQVFL